MASLLPQMPPRRRFASPAPPAEPQRYAAQHAAAAEHEEQMRAAHGHYDDGDEEADEEGEEEEGEYGEDDEMHLAPEGDEAEDEEAEEQDDEEEGEETEQEAEFAEPAESSEAPAKREAKEIARIQQEIAIMNESIEGLAEYEVVDKLGEGTFSSVYKAIDLNHYAYDNHPWAGGDDAMLPVGVPSKKVYVALKRIYVTSSPQRILNELELMEELRDCANIAYLITAFRTEDQIVAVMPYSRHRDFREFYRTFPLQDMRCYFRCLFRALDGCHSYGIMHRDVKPANFLYDPASGEGVLCDFGLAERFEPRDWRGKCHHMLPTLDYPHGKVQVNRTVPSSHFNPGGALAKQGPPRSAGVNSMTSSRGIMAPPERIGYLKDDTRPGVRANRAGTRGFRAPEVLLKCVDQTTSLDMWSAGIILLAFLTKRFPLFNSNDDTEALLELMMIFGKKKMTQCALLHNRTLQCNIPTSSMPAGSGLPPNDGYRIPDFIVRLNPGIYDVPEGHPDPKAYSKEVTAVIDLARVLLHPDCTRRWTARQALEHPFLAELPNEHLVIDT